MIGINYSVDNFHYYSYKVCKAIQEGYNKPYLDYLVQAKNNHYFLFFPIRVDNFGSYVKVGNPVYDLVYLCLNVDYNVLKRL